MCWGICDIWPEHWPSNDCSQFGIFGIFGINTLNILIEGLGTMGMARVVEVLFPSGGGCCSQWVDTCGGGIVPNGVCGSRCCVPSADLSYTT
jgi:hypothetical protein